MDNEKLNMANLADAHPSSRPGPITAIGAVILVGGGMVIYYWAAIKVSLGIG